VTDGARTRDIEDHNLALYQLSYGHQLASPRSYFGRERRSRPRYADCRL
jgi:hypothetical protein